MEPGPACQCQTPFNRSHRSPACTRHTTNGDCTPSVTAAPRAAPQVALIHCCSPSMNRSCHLLSARSASALSLTSTPCCRSALLSTMPTRSRWCSFPKPPATASLMRLLPPLARSSSCHSSKCHRREVRHSLPCPPSTATWTSHADRSPRPPLPPWPLPELTTAPQPLSRCSPPLLWLAASVEHPSPVRFSLLWPPKSDFMWTQRHPRPNSPPPRATGSLDSGRRRRRAPWPERLLCFAMGWQPGLFGPGQWWPVGTVTFRIFLWNYFIQFKLYSILPKFVWTSNTSRI
jgi:hypothetical protein